MVGIKGNTIICVKWICSQYNKTGNKFKEFSEKQTRNTHGQMHLHASHKHKLSNKCNETFLQSPRTLMFF